ncbi:MAG: hypothetical protein IPM45_00900 [Acidimicrobiales bacterium]|nr:hypothetical protein [Acidimicrobiales bacterium]
MSRGSASLRGWWEEGGLRETAWSWAVARVLIAVGALVAVVIADRLVPGDRPLQLHQGLFMWDGEWYRQIAEGGYRTLPAEALRFFPLYPLLGRLVGLLAAGRPAVGLVVVANAAAVAAGLVLHRLALLDLRDRAVARRSVWLLALLPPAFVLAFAYAEALMLALAMGTFLALRRERWWVAGLLGALAGVSRPIGLLLVLPALVEVLRGARGVAWRGWPARAAAVAGPAVGTVAYLAWAGARFGDWLEPLRVQEQFRGEAVDPVTRLGQGIGDLFGAERLGDGLHLPFAIAFVVLVVLVFRWLPVSYGLYSAAVLVMALSADNLNSLERYAMNAFPIVLALAVLTRRPLAEQVAYLVCAGGLVGLTALALTGAYVP